MDLCCSLQKTWISTGSKFCFQTCNGDDDEVVDEVVGD